MKRTRFLRCLAVAGLVAAAGVSQGQTRWPSWRGPQDNGVYEGGSFPVKWSADSGLRWKIPLPSKAGSTPIVWDGKIFLTSLLDDQDALLAVTDTGLPLWETKLGPCRVGKHPTSTGCNPSPITDGTLVYVYFKSGTLAAIGLDGKVRWKTNLPERFGPDTLYWDIATSPVLTERDVVVAVMHGGNSYIVAFDRTTGELHWKVSRDFKTAIEGDHGYSTPRVMREQGVESLLVWGAEHLTMHAAADGRTLWSCGNFNPEGIKNWPTVSSPVVAGGFALVSHGRGARLHAVKLGGSGDVTGTHRAWNRMDVGTYIPTPAVWNGRVYLLCDDGRLDCIAPDTGKSLWSSDLLSRGPVYYASPLIAGGTLYAVRTDGMVYVVRIEGRVELLAVNAMGEKIISSPVPLAGGLLLRGERTLFNVGTK